MLETDRWRLAYRLVSWSDDRYDLGVYLVLVNKRPIPMLPGYQPRATDSIVKVSKYPITPRYNGSPVSFEDEVKAYADAINHPILDGNNFHGSDFWFINGFEGHNITDEKMMEVCNSEYDGAV